MTSEDADQEVLSAVKKTAFMTEQLAKLLANYYTVLIGLDVPQELAVGLTVAYQDKLLGFTERK